MYTEYKEMYDGCIQSIRIEDHKLGLTYLGAHEGDAGPLLPHTELRRHERYRHCHARMRVNLENTLSVALQCEVVMVGYDRFEIKDL